MTGGWRCDVPITDVPAASTASSCSGRTFDGPQPNRPSFGSRPAGSVNVAGLVRRSLCQHGSRVSSIRLPCLSARLASITESATLAVDAKAKALQAAGEAVVGFGAGEPDFPTPQHIVEAAAAACRDPKYHRYSPAGGMPDLKEAIAVKTKRDSGFDCSASQVLVTNGGKHAVFTAFAALCDPGDEVICPAPYWTTYPEAITLAGGVPKVIDTTEETGFQVTVEQLDEAYTERTKVLLFVSPDNPSGAVYSPDQVKAIGEWAVERGVWVVTDEIYEHLTYGPHEFTSMPVARPRRRRAVRDRQRRRQDVRHDGLARRVDDLPAGRDQGGDELPEPRHVERVQRGPAGRAGRRERRPRGGRRDARRVRAARRARCTRCCRRSTV